MDHYLFFVLNRFLTVALNFHSHPLTRILALKVAYIYFIFFFAGTDFSRQEMAARIDSVQRNTLRKHCLAVRCWNFSLFSLNYLYASWIQIYSNWRNRIFFPLHYKYSPQYPRMGDSSHFTKEDQQRRILWGRSKSHQKAPKSKLQKKEVNVNSVFVFLL